MPTVTARLRMAVFAWQSRRPKCILTLAMPDLTNAKLIYLKGFLFFLCGCLASALLFFDRPTLRTALLIALAVWSFARAYYFAFYVIEHYVDPGYRFAGLWSFARYCRRGGPQISPGPPKHGRD